MSAANYDCPQCGGRLNGVNGSANTFECRHCGEEVREVRMLAREEPEAFERVARMAEDELRDLMLDILEEENGGAV